MNLQPLQERLSFDQAKMQVESRESNNGGKDLYMKGIFIQGDKINHNQPFF